jgi:hypothetical protein
MSEIGRESLVDPSLGKAGHYAISHFDAIDILTQGHDFADTV